MKFGGPQSDEMAWVIVAHEPPLTSEKRVFELGCDGALDIARSESTPPCFTSARMLPRHWVTRDVMGGAHPLMRPRSWKWTPASGDHRSSSAC